MTSFAATRAGRAAYTVAALAATYYCAWLATAPLQQAHPALASIFPPAAAATTVAVWAASALTVGVLGYCVYVFVAAAVISDPDRPKRL